MYIQTAMLFERLNNLCFKIWIWNIQNKQKDSNYIKSRFVILLVCNIWIRLLPYRTFDETTAPIKHSFRACLKLFTKFETVKYCPILFIYSNTLVYFSTAKNFFVCLLISEKVLSFHPFFNIRKRFYLFFFFTCNKVHLFTDSVYLFEDSLRFRARCTIYIARHVIFVTNDARIEEE